MIFSAISSRFHIRFKDRESAANLLAKAIEDLLKQKIQREESVAVRLDEERNNTIILGIPRGGVVLAEIIARKLHCEFDMIIPRRILAPTSKELAIGAVMEDGTSYLNSDLIGELKVSQRYIEEEKFKEIEEIGRRKSLYCNMASAEGQVKLSNNTKEIMKGAYKNRIVILVDDGIATGATLIVAPRWIRMRQPKYLVIAAPVAPRETRDVLVREADEIEIITSPSKSQFKGVAQFYRDFRPVEDEQVIEIMRRKSLSKS